MISFRIIPAIFLLTCILTAGMLFAVGPVQAQVLSTIEDMYMGRWIVIDNSSVQTITVRTNGNVLNTPGVYMIDPPQEGIYQVTGMDPFETYTITAVELVPIQGAGAPDFTMGAFEFLTPDADAFGTTTVTMGLTASSSGDGTHYGASAMTGTVELTFNF